MKRRDFIKSGTIVGVGISTATGSTLGAAVNKLENTIMTAPNDSVKLGAIRYNQLVYGRERVFDTNSLIPNKYLTRRPYFAKYINQKKRLGRTKPQIGEIIYKTDREIKGFLLEADFSLSEHFRDADIQIYGSINGVNYYEVDTTSTPCHNPENSHWQHFYYHRMQDSGRQRYFLPGTIYLKILLKNRLSSPLTPQLKRIEIFTGDYGEQYRRKLVDELDDFSKIHSHSSNLIFYEDNPAYHPSLVMEETKSLMEEQIEMAAGSGIDYWALLDCGFGSYCHNATNLFFDCSNQEKLQFNMMIHSHNPGLETFAEKVDRLSEYTLRTNYLRDADDRPIFMFFDLESFTAEEMGHFREAVKKKSGQDPLILRMARGEAFDGEWRYIADPGFDRKFWEKRIEQGTPVIPNVTTGMNDAPRHTNPPAWGNAGMTKEILTNEAFEKALTKGLQWVAANKEQAIANSLLIYAWDEYAEGGWLCPTYNANGEIDSSRLEIIKRVTA